ncbi:MAG: LamG-like jellyroll fold domain-containing protein [Planctomycetota bacterium]
MKRTWGRLGRVALAVSALVVLGHGRALSRGSWFDEIVRKREALPTGATSEKKAVPLPDFGTGKYTVTLWVKTNRDGALFAKTAPKGGWVRNGKALFIRGGRLTFDVGSLGAASGRRRVADGKWHHVAFCGGAPQSFYVDGALDGSGDLEARPDVKGSAFKIGQISTNFPPDKVLRGEIDEVRIHGRVLSGPEIRAEAEATSPPSADALIAYWPFDGTPNDGSRGLNHASAVGRTRYAKGEFGQALSLAGSGHMLVECGEGKSPDAELWRELAARFTDATSAQEMAWERADGIWGPDWRTAGWDEVAKRYAKAAARPTSVAREVAGFAARVRTSRDIGRVRELYLKSRRYGQLLEQLSEFRLDELRATVDKLHGTGRAGRGLLARLDDLEGQATRWQDGPPSGEAFETWKAAVRALRRDAILNENPLIDFDKVAFIKRLTYSANHYYTEYVNARWTPGGGICILDLKTGDVKEIATELKDGVFMRFDVSFDAKRIVFDWKCASQEGYRIYEVNVDGTGLRQLTFPDKNEKEIQRLYRARPHYHHGTDDMHPCYLPNGDICFISTRCQYGILCDGPDDFTTTILYRMDANGKDMRPLTNSSVSEASPVVLPDGRIMYTRWEYVDKGAVSVKCLWAMRPDGTNSAEIYANDISLPPTFI